jgi:hypothetical protein
MPPDARIKSLHVLTSMFQKRPNVFPPPPDIIASGIKLVSRIAAGTARRVGAVSDENGFIRWRYGPHRARDSWTPGNPLRKPDFVFFERDERDALKIRRVSMFPSVFNLLEEGKLIGNVRMSSVLRNRYSIELDGSKSWTFHMPLYTIYFSGESTTGTDVWVAIGPRENQWNILLAPGLPERPFAAILAFIHNERYFYS